jgi:hypothetical protein
VDIPGEILAEFFCDGKVRFYWGFWGNWGAERGFFCEQRVVECAVKMGFGCAVFGGRKLCSFWGFIFGWVLLGKASE